VPFRLVQLSDTHLSAARGYGVSNFDAVVEALDADPPDLVVATGDLALDDPDDRDDRAFARRRFDAIAAPWRAVPGNHDVGDDGPDPWMGEPLTDRRREAWVDAWGADWWMEEAGEWVLIGLDSLLLGSDLPAEALQASWLAGVAARAGRRPVMVMLHKPLFLSDPHEPPATQKTVTAEGRRRLGESLGAASVQVVASGHLHQFRASVSDNQALVWAPSTCFVIRAGEPSAYGGIKTVGAVEYRFEGRAVTWRLLRPAAMVDHDVHDLAGDAESLRFAPPRPAA
jgi:3',5'-cyclic AMP phosphodiesterase CpdA